MVRNIVKIQIIDSGKDKYLIKPQPFVLGRQYENNATEIQIERPANEKDSACFLVATNQYGEVLDHIDMANNKCLITNNLSKHKRIYIGFYFSGENDYLKGSEIATCDFFPSPKPNGFVPVEPEQKQYLDYLIKNAITKTVDDLVYYYKKTETYTQQEVENLVNKKVAQINATQIRNKSPNLVIEATSANVQEIATKYIVDNYERQPQEFDGLYLTFTDHENQIVEYAYHNNAWVSAGFDKVDLSNYVDLITEQRIGGRKVFEDETTFNKQVEFNENALLNDSKIITTDTTTDSVVKYGANSIEVERNNGSKKVLNIPNKDGTLAIEEDVDKKLAFKYARFENSGKDDVIVTDDIDSSVAMYHRNGTTQAGFVAQKNYAEQSTIDTTADGTVTQTKVANGNGVSSIEAEDNQGNKSSIKVSTTDIEVNKRLKVKETDDGIAVDVSIKTDLENYVEKQSETLNGNDKFYSQVSNENGEFSWSISRNSDDPLHSFRANKNGVFIDNNKVYSRKIKKLSNVAISTIFNDIQIDSVLSVKIRFRADANLKGISFDQIVSDSGQTIANYSASDSALIATANEVLVLYKSYNYESNYEFSVGNYKLSIINGSIPILSYYGIQYRTGSNGIHWIVADSTTDFKVDAEIEIEN